MMIVELKISRMDIVDIIGQDLCGGDSTYVWVIMSESGCESGEGASWCNGVAPLIVLY